MSNRLGDLRDRLDRATAHLDPPLAVIDITAFDHNAAARTVHITGKPLRMTSKSVRRRRVGDRVWFATPRLASCANTFAELHLVDGERTADTVPTYRGGA